MRQREKPVTFVNEDEAPVTVKKVAVDKKELVLTDIDGMDWIFELTKPVVVWIDDKQASLEDLQRDEEVIVTFAFRDDASPIAKEIRCVRGQNCSPEMSKRKPFSRRTGETRND